MRPRGVEGWVRRQGRKEDRRRKPKINQRAAPKGSNQRGSKVEFKGHADRKNRRRKSEIGRKGRAGDATAGVGRVIRQAGPKGRSAARAEDIPEGSAARVSGRRESEVRFEGGTGRLSEGACWRAAGRLGRKTGRRRKLRPVGRQPEEQQAAQVAG